MIQKILLATDGSSHSERALSFAVSLAKSYRTSIVIVHAFTPAQSFDPSYGYPNIAYETRDQAVELVERVSNRLREMGIPEVEAEVIEGPAVHVIVGAAETHQPDILVIGARGQSLWPGFQLGSVSMAVAQRVECTVLVVR